MKKLLIIVAMLLILSGCAEERQSSYSIREIYKTGHYGFFVKDEDTFYPVTPLEEGETNFKWLKGELKCPEVTANTPLVAVFGENNDMPDSYYIERFESLGFTIGSNVSVGTDGRSLWLDASSTCPESDLNRLLIYENANGSIELESINNQLPISNVDTDINIMIGLQENKYYDLSFYLGTQNKKVKVCADTFVLKKTDQTTLDNPLKRTHEQYFVVTLPENIKPGYYNISGAGFFEIK